jgi:Ca2+-binding EF-hand superfamily protein
MNKLGIHAVFAASLLGFSLSAPSLAAGEPPQSQSPPRPGGAGLAAAFFERLDANGDGQVTRAEAEAAGQQLFDKLDANKDGEVTAQEAEDGARATQKEELPARFKRLDTNKDGRLTPEEMKIPAMLFDRLDTNHDKFVSREEFRAVADASARGDTGFKKIDRDADGKVTRAEGIAAVQRRFAAADPNGDGVITRAEIEAHVKQTTKPQGQPKKAKPKP